MSDCSIEAMKAKEQPQTCGTCDSWNSRFSCCSYTLSGIDFKHWRKYLGRKKGSIACDKYTEISHTMSDSSTAFAGNRTIVVGAVRYYLGRHTSSVYTAAAFIADHKHLLDDGTREILERDISEWLDENPTCEWCGVDDRKPWVDLLNALREVEHDS